MNNGSSVTGPCGKVLWWWEMKVLALSNEASREMPETNDQCVDTHLSCLAARSDPRDVWLSSLPSSIHICPWIKKLAKGVWFTNDTPTCHILMNITWHLWMISLDPMIHSLIIHIAGRGKTVITSNMNHRFFSLQLDQLPKKNLKVPWKHTWSLVAWSQNNLYASVLLKSQSNPIFSRMRMLSGSD